MRYTAGLVRTEFRSLRLELEPYFQNSEHFCLEIIVQNDFPGLTAYHTHLAKAKPESRTHGLSQIVNTGPGRQSHDNEFRNRLLPEDDLILDNSYLRYSMRSPKLSCTAYIAYCASHVCVPLVMLWSQNITSAVSQKESTR